MQDKKNFLLIGLNGKIGKAVAQYGVKKFFVHCLMRSAPQVGINSIFFKIIDGDATKPQDLENALEGKDGVISAFGVSDDSPSAISDYTDKLITAMKKKGIKRLVCVGSSGNLQKQGKPYFQSNDYPQNLKTRAADHHKAMKLIQDSGLNYTIVCPHKNEQSEDKNEAKIVQNASNEPVSNHAIGKLLIDIADQDLHSGKIIGVKNK